MGHAAADPAGNASARFPGVSARDITVSGATGPLSARLYRPHSAFPLPVVLYFHGGGEVIANKEACDGSARGIAAEADAAVLSVDYRQAPEHALRTAWDDAIAAYRWVLAHADSLGGTGDCIALAGEGAGGTLALATAIAARDAGLPAPVHVLAIHPITRARLDTDAYVEHAAARALNRALAEWFMDQLVTSRGDPGDSRPQLIHADLSGLPGVSIVNADIDPLRSDGESMEEALRKAGIQVERRNFDSATHDVFGCAPLVGQAREAQKWAGERLEAAFATTRPTGG